MGLLLDGAGMEFESLRGLDGEQKECFGLRGGWPRYLAPGTPNPLGSPCFPL
jgi:hypothetical protein